MAKNENPTKSDIAPEPPNVAPPSPPSPPSTSGQNAPSPHAGLPPVLNPDLGTMRGDSLRERALQEDALRSTAAVPPAVQPRTLSELAAAGPTGPKEIPVQPDDPKQIRPTQVMGGLSFVNDRVEPGTTPLTPDHVNPSATAEQRRASLIKTVEEADIAARRREHAEMRPRIDEEIARREAAGDPLTR